MKLIRSAAIGICVSLALCFGRAQAASEWAQPAASLAEQIAGILGPGQARLSIQNLSAIPNDALPAIRKLIERDLKAHGIVIAEEESANAIRVTLSENVRERLWVAEVVEGNSTQVAMVEVPARMEKQAANLGGLTLRLQTMLVSREPVLAALETANGMVVLEPEQIVLYTRGASGWDVQSRASIATPRPLTRDPRGRLIPDGTGAGFDAWMPGTECTGTDAVGAAANDWTVNCRASDDPWPVTPIGGAAAMENTTQNMRVTPMRAFYNASRDYFTGVLAPNTIADLPPFYSFVELPRGAGTIAWLVNGIDGKLQSIENGAPHTVTGTRDWGSDFAAINSGCGAGWQVVATGSGLAAMDSLRAYEVPALDAIPASNPLEVSGAITALWTAPDEKSILAMVNTATDRYEVDRVTALCN
jgi:hypothetical protein